MSTRTLSTAPLASADLASATRRPGALGPMAAATPRILLSVNEAAAALGIGRTLMYELLGSGQVESVFVGRLHRVPAEALAAFVEKLRSEREFVRPQGSRRAILSTAPVKIRADL